MADRWPALAIHVQFILPPGATGLTPNTPLLERLVDNAVLVRGTWGGAPAPGAEVQDGGFVVEKNRVSDREGAQLETMLKASGRDMLIETGAWTNMSAEHTHRTRSRRRLSHRDPRGWLFDDE